MLILNEEKYAKALYEGVNKEIKSIMAKIRYVTRYLIHSEKKSDDEIYKFTVEWMKQHHNNFDESCYSNVISDAIKKAHQYPFYMINNINITQSELDTISSLNNLRAEKVLFVLLCMAKQQIVSNGFTNGLVKYSITELCKLARISVPADDREYILYDIVKRGFLGYPKKNNTQCLIVNFISNDDEVALTLDEMDCQELAYVYLNWKNDGKGYTRCTVCNRLMRQSKTKPRKYCEECSKIVNKESTSAKYEAIGNKIVVCIDCGKQFVVSAKATEACRCDECKRQYRNEYMKELMRVKRQNNLLASQFLILPHDKMTDKS